MVYDTQNIEELKTYPTALSRVQIRRETSTNIPRYCTVIWTVGYFVLYKNLFDRLAARMFVVVIPVQTE